MGGTPHRQMGVAADSGQGQQGYINRCTTWPRCTSVVLLGWPLAPTQRSFGPTQPNPGAGAGAETPPKPRRNPAEKKKKNPATSRFAKEYRAEAFGHVSSIALRTVRRRVPRDFILRRRPGIDHHSLRRKTRVEDRAQVRCRGYRPAWCGRSRHRRDGQDRAAASCCCAADPAALDHRGIGDGASTSCRSFVISALDHQTRRRSGNSRRSELQRGR